MAEDLVEGVTYRIDACSQYGDPGPFELRIERDPPRPVSAEKKSEALQFARDGLRTVQASGIGSKQSLGAALHRLAFILNDPGQVDEELKEETADMASSPGSPISTGPRR